MARLMYDIGAGENLSSLLTQLNDKLVNLASQRAGWKQIYLDCDPGNWTGGDRAAFDADFPREQAGLSAYAEAALTAKKQVEAANQAYYTAARTGAPAE